MSDMSDSSDDETYEPSANVGISCPEYSFTRGLKGRLTTTHSNPRCLQQSGFKTLSEKLKVVEGSRDLSTILAEYNEIKSHNSSMADGILLGLMNNFRMTKRESKEVFHIGSTRWARIAKGQPAKVCFCC
jgi:NAD-dependent DNA ligase